ncbi:DNA mismatch repair endonuclease MutL [Mesocricetibacter intestinalis]|uniref:DNA mismatch repair endonuclease MutL n=1 Tax=Mesocricetibacter intestinalis TaxID=1521930 RepID=UPI00105CABBB|nr:DNA mismatch repair endonuclease MutL [Mesocricetibacter intestinalis]
MPIQILSAQLANQIAAGEVVERPASVVKELVENSLDAGASHIRIDIEKGGAGLIRIRDNGIGIPKQELALALARHATSKIASLEDLDAILSLGFRGEALASISSVSRLTLTSRTQEQNEAWQVYAQGRDMETTLTPASHPVGTTVEVANLFFNTPARRKFLRTDKTEFAHIDEVIRRIALAKPQVTFVLTHNGKTLRQYKSATNNEQRLKRVAAICGQEFVQNALQIDWKHEDYHLYGWVGLPRFYRLQNDLAYCYINGRMIRDKVITHAIRQAYAEYLSNEQYPAFVLFLDLNPHEVDVNVHPTKHEVRFHQSRLIHDFVSQGVSNALQSDLASEQPMLRDRTQHIEETRAPWLVSGTEPKPNRAAAGQNKFTAPETSARIPQKNTDFRPHFLPESNIPSKAERQAYRQLMTTLPQKAAGAAKQSPAEELQAEALKTRVLANSETEHNQPPHQEASAPDIYLRSLALIEDKALLLQRKQCFYLLPLEPLQRLKLRLSLAQAHIPTQPLLIPIVFRLDQNQYKQWQRLKSFFADAGFEFAEHSGHSHITLNLVPNCLRRQNLQNLIISLLQIQIEKTSQFLTALCERAELAAIQVYADAVNLLTEVEQLGVQTQELESLLIPVDFNRFLNT